MVNVAATNDNDGQAGRALTLARRLEASFADLASTRKLPSAPIMWMSDPKPDAQTQRDLSTLSLADLEKDLETVNAMLTYGAAKTQQEFAPAVTPLMAMPSTNRDELATAVYAQLIWQSFRETPLWALSLAVATCARREVFRPLPVTLEGYMPIAFKRASARAWELTRAISLHKTREVAEAKTTNALTQEREARIAALPKAARATYEEFTAAGDWRAAASVLAQKPGSFFHFNTSEETNHGKSQNQSPA